MANLDLKNAGPRGPAGLVDRAAQMAGGPGFVPGRGPVAMPVAMPGRRDRAAAITATGR